MILAAAAPPGRPPTRPGAHAPIDPVRAPGGGVIQPPFAGWRLARALAGWTRRARERAVNVEPAPHERSAAPDPVVEALRAGDEAAFLQLVRQHHAAMVRVATAYVGSRAVAEEVAQEAWIGVLQGLRLFEGRSSLRTWIFRILVNCAKARGVREVRSVPLSSLADEGDDGPAVPEERFAESGVWAGHWARPPAEWTDDQLGSAELAALVREGIETLPPAQRQVMTLRDVEGWESAEVCELMGVSEGNQRVLLHRARSKVRALVEARLGKEARP
jgi:RNA polymerase sigma-70 factor (ECF subfamily)